MPDNYVPKKPDHGTMSRSKKISLAIGLVIGLAIIPTLLTWLVYCKTTGTNPDLFACRVIFPFIEFYLVFWLLVAISWSLFLYFGLRLLMINEPENPFTFHELAETHKEWAQLWFTISIAIVIGGLIYATFHVGSHACDWMGGGSEANHSWKTIVASTLPNLFIYSLFFVSWQWSSKHFRAHWHNFITNAYRHRGLEKFKELEKMDNNSIDNSDKSATIAALRRLAGLLLLVPRESAYLSAEKEDTVTERMLRLEELIRETLIGK